jgi:hypothetical protein
MLPAKLDDTYALVRSRVTRTAYRLTRGSGPPPSIEVEILSGVHANCRTEIALAEFTIGGDDAHDLMLIDDCLAGEPINVTTRRTLLGPVLIVNTARTDVEFAGQGLSKADVVERLPCQLSVGDVDMIIRARHTAPVQTARLGRKEWLIAAGLAVAGLVAVALPWPLHPGSTSGRALTLSANTAAPAMATSPPSFATDLEQRIESHGLSDYLVTAENPDGTLVVSGPLPPTKMALWDDLQREIDTQTEPGRVLFRVSQASELQNVPAIRIVRLGEAPELLLADRRTVAVGDELVDGWLVDEITADGVTVTRDGESVKMTY